MKKFEESNYYEILEVPFSATNIEIREAYRNALSIYSEDSLATYSLFTNDERADILNQIEKAFNTLTDKKSRDEYDRSLVKSGYMDMSTMDKKDQKKSIPLFSSPDHREDDAFLKKIKNIIENNDSSREISDEILSKEMISGSDLKRLRTSFGIKLEDIYEVARISVSTLKSIEENRAENLLPDVYLKNFLKIYAELFKIDSKKVIDGYLKNLHNCR